MADTHLQSYKSKDRVLFNAPPTSPVVGDFFFDNLNNRLAVFNRGQWWYAMVTTTTSTSTSTTSTSTSTTSTSSSTSSSSSTSTSTTTSTTTTL